MRVVHEQREGFPLRARGQQAERRGPDREAILGARRAERQRAGKRGRLRRRDPVQNTQHGAQQLGEPSKRDLGLRLDPAGAQDPHPAGVPGGVIEQRGLADPRFADERQHTTAAVSRLTEQAAKREPLLVAAQQHGRSLTSPAP